MFRLSSEMETMSESPESERTDDSGVAIGRELNDTVAGRKDREWILVAAGLERFFFLLYTIAFAVVSSSYI